VGRGASSHEVFHSFHFSKLPHCLTTLPHHSRRHTCVGGECLVIDQHHWASRARDLTCAFTLIVLVVHRFPAEPGIREYSPISIRVSLMLLKDNWPFILSLGPAMVDDLAIADRCVFHSQCTTQRPSLRVRVRAHRGRSRNP
jgi:hypothetical protein